MKNNSKNNLLAEAMHHPRSASKLMLLVAFLFITCQISSIKGQNPIQKIYVQASRSSMNCSYSCSGSLDNPFDSLLSALKSATKLGNVSVEILLLKAPHHFVLINELEEEMLQHNQSSQPSSSSAATSTSSFYLDFNSSSVFILPVSVNITIRPAICIQDVYVNPTQGQSNSSNCYQTGETANIVFKSFDFQIVVQSSLILRDLNFIGNEDISVFNSYNNQTSVKTCLSNRIHCCANPEAPFYPDIKCTGNVTLRNLTTDARSSSVFLLNQTQTNLTPQVMFNNCNFQRISLTKKKNFIALGTENSHNLKISSSNFSEIFTPYGLIGLYSSASLGMNPMAETSKMFSQSIDITSSVFSDFNPNISFVLDQDSPDSDGYILNMDSHYGGNITVDSNIIKGLKGSRTSATSCLDDSRFMDPFSSEGISLLADFANRFVRDHFFNTTSSVFRVESLSGSLTLKNNSFYKNLGKSGTVLSVKLLKPEGNIELTENTFDGNFATTGFPTVRISANISNYFNSSICGNVIINGNTIRNHLTCRNGYGNLMLFCGTIRSQTSNSPALGLSEALVNLASAQKSSAQNSSDVLIADEILPSYYLWNNLTISNNLFTRNLIQLSNSISVFGGRNVEIVDNTFSANGVPFPFNEEFQTLQSTYFEEISDPSAFSFDRKLPYLTTVLITEQTKEMKFSGNLFQDNWNLLNMSQVFSSHIYLRNVPEFFEGLLFTNCSFKDLNRRNIDSLSQNGSSTISVDNSSPLIVISYLTWPKFLVHNNPPNYSVPIGLTLSGAVFEGNSFNFTLQTEDLYDDDQEVQRRKWNPGVIKILPSLLQSKSRPRTLFVTNSLILNNTFYGGGGYLFSNSDFVSIFIMNSTFSGNKFSDIGKDEVGPPRIPMGAIDSPAITPLEKHSRTLILAAKKIRYQGYVLIDNCTFSQNKALLIHAYTPSSVQINNTIFIKNERKEDGLIVGMGGTLFAITETKFIENTVQSGIVILEAAQLFDSRNLFEKNYGDICNGYFVNSMMDFHVSESTFSQNTLKPTNYWRIPWRVPLAASIWMIDSQGNMTRTIIKDNNLEGGFIHMKSSVLTLDSCKITDNVAQGEVGLAFVSSSSFINFSNATISQNQQFHDAFINRMEFYPGMIVLSSSDLIIENSKVLYNSIGNGSSFIAGQAITAIITNSSFLSNYDFSSLNQQGSSFLISFSFGMLKVAFSNFTYNGQLLKLIDGKTYFKGNKIIGFQFGLTGFQILIDALSGNLFMEKNDFYQTTGGLSSLILLRSYDTDVLFQNCSFSSINQGSEPMFKLTGKSSFLQNLLFKDISSDQPIIRIADMGDCKVKSIQFTCNSYWRSAVEASNVINLTLKDMTICHNQLDNVFRVANSTALILKNITIYKTVPRFTYYMYSNLIQDTLIRLENNQNIVIVGLTLKDQVMSSSNLHILNRGAKNTIAITNSTFMSNQATEAGAISFSLANWNTINITNSTFVNNSAVLYSLSGNSMISSLQRGGALNIVCARDNLSVCDIDIRNCSFHDNSALEGGAIYWEGYPPFVLNTEFRNNSAIYGPNLASEAVRVVIWTPDIKKLVNFDLNPDIEAFRSLRDWPKSVNLAIIPDYLNSYSPENSLTRDYQYLNSLYWKIQDTFCSGSLLETIFHDSKSGDSADTIASEGGRWKFHAHRNLVAEDALRLLAQDAPENNDEMSLPAEAQYFATQLINFVHNQQQITDISLNLMNITDVVSGTQLSQSVTFALLDIYGQVVTTNYYSSISNISTNNHSKYALTIQGANVQASSGLLVIASMVAEYYPGLSCTVTFGVDRLDDLRESLGVVDYFSQMNKQRNIEINFSFRDCIDGEYFEVSSDQAKCTMCKANTFMITEVNNTQKPCGLCDKTTMVCLGGALVAPASGYWRLNQSADIFLACPNSGACLGGWNDSNGMFNFSGFCADEYRGPLCSKCIEGFAKYQSGSSCVNCRTNVWYYFRFAITFLLQALFIIFNVKTNLFIYENHQNRNFRQMRTRAFLLKMLTNYLQVVTLINSFSIDWPGFLKGIFSSNQAVSASSGDVFALDCLIYIIFGEVSTSLTFIKTTMALLLPIAFGLLLFLFWGLYFAVKKCKHRDFQFNRNLYMNYVLGSTIIVAFNLQPMVLKFGFLLFQCQNIYRSDSPLYHLVSDYDVQCWTKSHLLWAGTTGVLTITLWGAVVPLIIFINIWRAKRSVLKFEGTNALKYSFIVFGYKEETWYWEFVILIRKYLILIIITSVSGFSRGSQFTLIMLVILIASYLHNKYAPYESAALNRLETVSLFSIELFVIACLYFTSIDKISGLNLPVLLFCFAGNLIFLLRWLFMFSRAMIDHLKTLPVVRKAHAMVGKFIAACKLKFLRRKNSPQPDQPDQQARLSANSSPGGSQKELEIDVNKIVVEIPKNDGEAGGGGIGDETDRSIRSFPRRDSLDGSSSLLMMLKNIGSNNTNSTRPGSGELLTGESTRKPKKNIINLFPQAKDIITEIPDSVNSSPKKSASPKNERKQGKKGILSPFRRRSEYLVQDNDSDLEHGEYNSKSANLEKRRFTSD